MKRSVSKRSLRMGDQVMRIVASIVDGELRDPRLEGLTVTGARMNKSLEVAEILYSVPPGEGRAEEAARALEKASGFIRRQVGQELSVRRVPELRFVHDQFLENYVYDGPGTDSADS